MQVHLMFCDRDFGSEVELCFGTDALIADLALNPLLAYMAQNDEIIDAACRFALFRPLKSAEEIRYRQDNLGDALRNPDVVKKLYDLTIETDKKRRSSWFWLSPFSHLSGNFSSAVNLLRLYTEMLMQLRLIADQRMSDFQSEGFRNLFNLFQRELDDDYFAKVRSLLDDLVRSDAVAISATLGSYMQGVNYVLRRRTRKGFWHRWLFAPSYTVAPRDHSGEEDLDQRRGRAINVPMNALAQAAEHLEGFFAMLRRELAFYVGCLNLAERLETLGMPICIPDLRPVESEDRSWDGLFDVSLALITDSAVVGNELDALSKRLYIIAGANQGGKTTFLRSVGQAQLMAQCGMFVGADSFCAPIRKGIFSHFKKEEDAAMKSGKLDEELARLSEIVDHLEAGSLVLLNESFAATNEREGSEICRQITQALLEGGIEVFSVTHLYTYAASFREDERTQYLNAQRLESGERTFRVVPGEPQQTAFGEDLYQKMFGG